MMHLNSIPAELAQFIEDAVASGQYQSTEELVCDALQVLREQMHRRGVSVSPDTAHPASPLQSPDDYLQALVQALRTGEFGRARQVAMEGAERYPAHDELQTCARVLAPPSVRAVPASAASRASVKANNAWMKAHWQDYRGQWVAVRDGQLVYVASSFDDLVAHIGDPHGILLTKIH